MNVEIAYKDSAPYFVLSDPLNPNAKSLNIFVDFKKRVDVGAKSDILARAIGYKKSKPLKVIDATAGLCRDSFHLALLGCEVLALEKNSLIFQVMSFYVESMSSQYKISLTQVDAVEYLNSLSEENKPDIIYLDPMFPAEKNKSAKSAKETELLKALAPIESAASEAQLLTAALKCARTRVVVKRPLHAPALAASPLAASTKPALVEAGPQIQFKGKSVRYDVYLTRN